MTRRNLTGVCQIWDRLAQGWWLWGLVLAASLRFCGLEKPSLWYDEAFSFVMSTHSVLDILRISSTDVHPPLYYLLLKGWIALFGSGLLSLRSMSAVASVVAVGLGMWLTRLIANRRAAFIAGIFLAMLPIAVLYSREARMYALLSVWMTGATIALVYWVRTPQCHGSLVAYVVLIAAGLYTHYFALLGVAAHWIYLLMSGCVTAQGGHPQILRRSWLTANIAAAGLFLPWLPTLVRQLSNTASLGWISPVAWSSIPSVFLRYLMPYTGTQGFACLGITLGVLVVSGYCIARDRHPQRFATLVVVYLWAPLLLVFVASLAMPLLIERYLAFSALALPILAAISVDDVMHRHRSWGGAMFFIVLGVAVIGLRDISVGDSAPANRGLPGEIGALATVMNSDYQDGDQVIVLNELLFPSMIYYSTNGPRPVLLAPMTRDLAPRYEVYRRFSGFYNHAYVERLDAMPARIRRVWLMDSPHAAVAVYQLPHSWINVQEFSQGENRLRLFVVQPALNGANRQP